MDTTRIAPHETFELHELLTFKTVCATKSDAMSKMVKDPELKALLENDYALGRDHIRELASLLKLSDFYDGADGGVVKDETDPIQ